MLRRLRRYLALAPADRRLLHRAYLALVVTDVELRLLGFRRVVERDQGRTPGRTARPEELATARRYAHWLGVASRHHLVRMRCLHRSLALHRWLRDQGLTGELRIGVCKRGDELKAHAWVELAGQLVSDDRPEEVAAFTPLTTPDGAAPNWARTAHSSKRRPSLAGAWGLPWS